MAATFEHQRRTLSEVYAAEGSDLRVNQLFFFCPRMNL